MTPANSDHRNYDNPRLTPYQFLLEVMRDQTAPLPTRVDAAGKLVLLVTPAMYQEPEYTIRLPDHGQLQ